MNYTLYYFIHAHTRLLLLPSLSFQQDIAFCEYIYIALQLFLHVTARVHVQHTIYDTQMPLYSEIIIIIVIHTSDIHCKFRTNGKFAKGESFLINFTQ